MVREVEKTPEWVELHLKSISKKSATNENIKNDVVAWNYYHNKINSVDTDYLTKIGNFELPAKVRRIPKQRPFLDRLSSQQERRPFVFSVVLADKKSVEEKYLDQVTDYINAIEDQARYVHFETSFQIQEIKGKIQEMQQMAQQQPQTAEEAQRIGEIKKVLPRIMNNFQYAIAMLEKKDALTVEQVQEMQYYHKYDKKDWKEIIAQKTLLKLRNELGINAESTTAFITGEVVGREYYYVDYIAGNRLPVLQSLEPLTVTYPKISSVKWVQDGPWVQLTDYTSFDDIVIKYGKQIEDKYGKVKLEKLEDSYTETTSNMITGRGGEAYFNDTNSMYNGSDGSGYGIKVERIWFKVPRNIKVKYTPNPFEDGVYFRHFIQNKEVIDLKYWKDEKNGFYINKKNPKDIRSYEEVETVRSDKGEEYKDKYTNDLYHGVIINNEFIVDEGKVALVLRDIDRHGKINLPVFGKTYSSLVDQPYSLIMATKDLQDLFDIVHYHQELMLALSGVKTILFDTAFKPSTMTDEEWEADKKKGVMNIETVGPDGKRPQSQFNQWTMFDMSVSSSISTLDNIKENIEMTMGDIIGVPRQLKGQLVNTDQVGTYNASVKQAGLITEIRFAEHDLIEAKALTHCLNLALTYCYKDGETFGINNSDLSGEIINIPKNVLNNVRFAVLVANNTDEGQGIEDMKQLILGNWKAGQMSFSDVSELWGIKTLTELTEKAKYMAAKAEKIRQMAVENASQAEVEKEKLKIQLNNELLAPWKEQEAKMKEMELSIKDNLGKMNIQILAEKNAILQKQVEQEGMIKGAQIQTDRESNERAVAVNDRHLSNDEQIRLLEIQVNSLLEDARLKKDDITSRRKFHVDNKKNAILNHKQMAERSNKVTQ